MVVKQVITEDEKKQFLKNEERLWDLAALTISPTIYQCLKDRLPLDKSGLDFVAIESYDLADALMAERRKRLAEPVEVKVDLKKYCEAARKTEGPFKVPPEESKP